MIADSLALSTFDLASACLGALRRQAGGSQANGSGLPEAGNGRSLGLNRLPFGGCRVDMLLRLDNANTLPTYPQRRQKEQESV